MVGRGKRQPAAATVIPCREAQGSLGGDVDAIRVECIQFASYAATREYREADFRVSGQWYGPAPLGRDHANLVPERFEFVTGFRQGLHDAVYLWLPRVGDDRYAHAGHRRHGA